MLNILKSDIFRIIKGKLCFYSITGLILFGIFFGVVRDDTPSLESIQDGLSTASIFVSIFMINIFIIVWGHEFTNRVVNNSLIFGIKRSIYFYSKVLLTFGMTFLFLAVYTCALAITVWITSGGFSLLETLKIFFLQMPLYFVVSLLGVLLFNVIKSGNVASSIFVALILVGEGLISSVISTFFPAANALLDTLLFTNIRQLTDYLNLSGQTLSIIFISALVYGLILYVCSYIVFKERDFK
ncbi:hypothetical protein PML95_04005 [Vagococcus lutrae]|uniref:ABC transporter permease n=1 Tax=Vagococcus lutrae TaxID=81947 RepID=A0AAE9XGR6_9ENTE|nr:hypothetical protein [Vagococcus lutrae]WCG23416.1 hypothetical protein PML95_04005 [Vagococcus lutrae]